MRALPPRLDLGRLPEASATRLFGRDSDLAQVLDAWDQCRVSIVAMDAMGGAGKTALVRRFVDVLEASGWRGAHAAFAWSFYSQGSSEDRQVGADEFFDEALAFFGYGRQAVLSTLRLGEELSEADIKARQIAGVRKIRSVWDKGLALAGLIKERRVLLILDGLEPLQYAAGARGGAVGEEHGREGGLKDRAMRALVEQLAHGSRAFCLITTRLRISELKSYEDKPVMLRLALERIPLMDAIDLLRAERSRGDDLLRIGVEPRYPPARFKLPPRSAFPDAERTKLPETYTTPAERIPPEDDDRAAMPWREARDLVAIVEGLKGNALALNHVANFLVLHHEGDARAFGQVPDIVEMGGDLDRDPFRVMRAAEYALSDRIVQMGHRDSPAQVIAGRELGLLFVLGFFDRPADLALLPVVFAKDGALAPEAADLALATTDLSGIEDDPKLDWDARNARKAERERRWAEVKPVWNARQRVLVRRLFGAMYGATVVQITEALGRLANLGLIARRKLGDGRWEVDCHPLVREYFGARLKQLDRDAFKAAHARLYDHYRYAALPRSFHDPVAYALLLLGATYPKNIQLLRRHALEGKLPPGAAQAQAASPILQAADSESTARAARLIGGADWDRAVVAFLPAKIEEMTPLFAAVTHGCAAELEIDAWRDVYWNRIARGSERFLTFKLGAYGKNLEALAAFFETPFTKTSQRLPSGIQRLILHEAGIDLRALGRLHDAIDAMRTNLDAQTSEEEWTAAANSAGNLSELLLLTGQIGGENGAVQVGAIAASFAERANNVDQRLTQQAVLASALFDAGWLAQAEAIYRETERLSPFVTMTTQMMPLLVSLAGYRYCVLLLARGRAAEVASRAEAMIRRSQSDPRTPTLTIALEMLAKARSALGGVPVLSGAPEACAADAAAALTALRDANTEEHVVCGLLAHAEALWRCGNPGSAGGQLVEAATIAARGPMPLFMADAYLLGARILLAEKSAERARAYRDGAAALVENHALGRAATELAVLDAEIASSENEPNRGTAISAAIRAVRGEPTGAEEMSVPIDCGWWGLLPRLEALVPAADRELASLRAARDAYNAERDAYGRRAEHPLIKRMLGH
jgi:hypothetical protein